MTRSLPTPPASLETCLRCKRDVTSCECTGGPVVEQECTCYEVIGGHQPGCALNRQRPTAEAAS